MKMTRDFDEARDLADYAAELRFRQRQQYLPRDISGAAACRFRARKGHAAAAPPLPRSSNARASCARRLAGRPARFRLFTGAACSGRIDEGNAADAAPRNAPF